MNLLCKNVEKNFNSGKLCFCQGKDDSPHVLGTGFKQTKSRKENKPKKAKIQDLRCDVYELNAEAYYAYIYIYIHNKYIEIGPLFHTRYVNVGVNLFVWYKIVHKLDKENHP